MYIKSLGRAKERADFYKVSGKKAATLLKYEFIYSYLSKILSRFPEHLRMAL